MLGVKSEHCSPVHNTAQSHYSYLKSEEDCKCVKAKKIPFGNNPIRLNVLSCELHCKAYRVTPHIMTHCSARNTEVLHCWLKKTYNLPGLGLFKLFFTVKKRYQIGSLRGLF